MKQKIFLLALCLTSTVLVRASTCETRVDQHQKATTQQRINYCLNEPATQVSDQKGPELIYENISYKEEQPKEEATKPLKQEYFAENEVGVERTYVDSAQFPAFKNDILSEQERKALEAKQQASQAPVDTLRNAVKPARILAQAGQQPAQSAAATATHKSKSAKLEKPSRMTNPVVETAPTSLDVIPAATKQPKEISYTEWMEQQALSGHLIEDSAVQAS